MLTTGRRRRERRRSGDHGTDARPLVKELGKLKLDHAKWLKELEKENGRLKRLVTELSLENKVLRDVAQGNF